MVEVIGVRFRQNGKIYFFSPNDLNIEDMGNGIRQVQIAGEPTTARKSKAADMSNGIR